MPEAVDGPEEEMQPFTSKVLPVSGDENLAQVRPLTSKDGQCPVKCQIMQLGHWGWRDSKGRWGKLGEDKCVSCGSSVGWRVWNGGEPSGVVELRAHSPALGLRGDQYPDSCRHGVWSPCQGKPNTPDAVTLPSSGPCSWVGWVLTMCLPSFLPGSPSPMRQHLVAVEDTCRAEVVL